ncbi:MAG: class I SAM-dependent methyltransferase [Pirellulales bacterium]
MEHETPSPDPSRRTSSSERAYVGTELPLFAKAVHWKRYFGRALSPYVGGDVLEVGAGFGGTTPFLLTADVRSWTALEPDPELAHAFSAHVRSAGVNVETEIRIGTVADLPGGRMFDCITYIDVLEHIEDDAAELASAAKLLRPGGHLVVLSPAYRWLYSEFDKAVGHFRRYTISSLRSAGPASLVPTRFFHLDAVGVAASFANRMLLRQSAPTATQIEFWDRRIVPISRIVDPLVLRSCGRSVIGIWRCPDSALRRGGTRG